MNQQHHDHAEHQFLIREAVRFERRAKSTWLLGLPFVALVAGYLSWVSYTWNVLVLNPRNVAHVVAQSFDQEAPEILRSAELTLLERAPDFARWIQSEVERTLSEVEGRAHHQIDTVFELIPVLDASSKRAVDEYFRERGPEVKLLFESQQREGFVRDVVDVIFDRFARELQAKLQVVHNGRPAQGLQKISLAQLHVINSRLQALAHKHPREMTPIERLERRVIVAWVHALGKDLNVRLYE